MFPKIKDKRQKKKDERERGMGSAVIGGISAESALTGWLNRNWLNR